MKMRYEKQNFREIQNDINEAIISYHDRRELQLLTAILRFKIQIYNVAT